MRGQKRNLTTGASPVAVEVHPGDIFPSTAVPDQQQYYSSASQPGDLPGLFPVRTMMGLLGQVSSLRAALTLARRRGEVSWDYQMRSGITFQVLLAGLRTSRLHPEPSSL